ncbi:pIIIb capsid protein [Psittacine aviadenovirus B]|uniref:PIIIb capsid protein n=1 Tax=psittacine adenovirus 4 TaxID=2773287 RepID=A0A1P8SW68_9ADEN|nr:pIIIb capsid protein [Psittacine aviadenovirus B]APY28349.1 pIIIb capsid protein [psittacine adenovirus 4]
MPSAVTEGSASAAMGIVPPGRMEVAATLTGMPDSKDARALRHAPYANRMISLQTAMVPPKVDGTSERVAEIVKGLAKQGAIYPDQMGAIHSELLNRAYTWNSLGVQESIQALVNDVIHGQNRTLQEELTRTKEIANASLLTRFFDSLYKTVDRGQRNFEGFKKLLRLFINNVPNAELYSSGGSYNLQINLGGTNQNINLTNAFENLKDIWGARWDAVNNPKIGALLTPNTRALLFFVSSFYDYGAMEPGTYLDNILRLYKEAIRADIDQDGDAVMELDEAGANLSKKFSEYKDTLNYLLHNEAKPPKTGPMELSREQESLLRYLMRQLRQAMKDGVPTDVSVATMAQYVDPRLYQTNKVFIEKLQNYLLSAQARNPGFYRAIVTDPQWIPPIEIYTGDFVIPDTYFGDPSSPSWGPSRDEYFDDAPYRPPPRRPISDADIRAEIENLMRQLDQDLGVQSEAGWLADHRLPAAFDGAINLGPPAPPVAPAPPPPPPAERYRPVARIPPRNPVSGLPIVNAADVPLPDSDSDSDMGGMGRGRRCGIRGGLYSDLKPSVGGHSTALSPELGTYGMRGSGLARRALCPRRNRLARRLRFY